MDARDDGHGPSAARKRLSKRRADAVIALLTKQGLGGIRVDADARVLDRDGRPIPGLFAAGADAGGVFHVGYAGGLASALVFGRRAASTALAEALGAPHATVTRV